MNSNPPPPLIHRLLNGFKRILKFVKSAFPSKVSSVLIFSGSGFGLVEKGVMACIGSILCKRVVFAPRGSGISRYAGMNRKLSRFFLRRADILLCQSTQWKKFYKNLTGFSCEKIKVVPNWIDVSSYLEIQIPPERKIVTFMFLGWMVRPKGIFDLLNVVKQTKPLMQNTRFIMCGGGEDLEIFKRKIQEFKLYSIFRVLGWINHKEKLKVLKDADAFVLPTHGEGMPNSLLEAMAAARPVIATNVGGIPDIIEHRVTGLLYEAKDLNALSKCMMCLKDDRELRVKLGNNARSYVQKNHDVKIIWPQVYNILNPNKRHIGS
jgi:glycosyltransferase involved in cell wall biosynthesis